MMLSRTANSLYWIGRYTERIGHLARYISAQYLSSSDLPASVNKKVVLESLLATAQASESFLPPQTTYSDHDVIEYLTINKEYPHSIKSYVEAMRENARGIRNSISTDVWEATNRFYHTTRAFSQQELSKRGPYDFCKHCQENVSIIKGVIDNTLLRDEAWSLIYAGIHLERAMQIAHILLTKLVALRQMPRNHLTPAMSNYHWATLLQSAGGLDMSRNHYGTRPTRELVTDFFILNRKFPKSILYNLEKLKNHLKTIANNQPITPDSVDFKVGKLAAYVQYLTVDEIITQEEEVIRTIEDKLYNIGTDLEQQYFIF